MFPDRMDKARYKNSNNVEFEYDITMNAWKIVKNNIITQQGNTYYINKDDLDFGLYSRLEKAVFKLGSVIEACKDFSLKYLKYSLNTNFDKFDFSKQKEYSKYNINMSNFDEKSLNFSSTYYNKVYTNFDKFDFSKTQYISSINIGAFSSGLFVKNSIDYTQFTCDIEYSTTSQINSITLTQ